MEKVWVRRNAAPLGQEGAMTGTILIGIVIVALGVGAVLYTFWHEGSPIRSPRRRRTHTHVG